MILQGSGGTEHAYRQKGTLADWQERAESVTAKALDCGHYLPEEAPDALLAELLMFLA